MQCLFREEPREEGQEGAQWWEINQPNGHLTSSLGYLNVQGDYDDDADAARLANMPPIRSRCCRLSRFIAVEGPVFSICLYAEECGCWTLMSRLSTLVGTVLCYQMMMRRMTMKRQSLALLSDSSVQQGDRHAAHANCKCATCNAQVDAQRPSSRDVSLPSWFEEAPVRVQWAPNNAQMSNCKTVLLWCPICYPRPCILYICVQSAVQQLQ